MHRDTRVSPTSLDRTLCDRAERDPARLVREAGLGGREELTVRWLVRWRGEKALDRERALELP